MTDHVQMRAELEEEQMWAGEEFRLRHVAPTSRRHVGGQQGIGVEHQLETEEAGIVWFWVELEVVGSS